MNNKINSWTSPYNSDSIWNTQVAEDIKTVNAGFVPAPAFHFDFECFIKAQADDTAYTVNVNGESVTVQIPETDFNNCEYACILQPDEVSVVQLRNAKIVDGELCFDEIFIDKLTDDGREGIHTASGLSAMGGTIRKDELLNDEPINHALKVRISSNRFLYYKGEEIPGYRYPARRTDSYAVNNIKEKVRYSGVNKHVVQGTLFTLPKDLTPQDIGLKSKMGKKIFYAIQNYGAYVSDSQAIHSIGFFCEYDVKKELTDTIGMRTEGWMKDCVLPNERDWAHDLNHIFEKMLAEANTSLL